MEIKIGMSLSIVGAIIALIGFFTPWMSGIIFGVSFSMSGFDLMKYMGTKYAFDASIIAMELVLSLIGLGMSFLYKRFATVTNIFVSVGGIAIPFHYIAFFITMGEGSYVGEGLIIEIIGFFILLIGSIHTNQKISEEKGASLQSTVIPQGTETPATVSSPPVPPQPIENPPTKTSEPTQIEQTSPQNDIEEQQ